MKEAITWQKQKQKMCISVFISQALFIFYPAMTAFTDQYSMPNNFFDIGQL